MYVEKIIFAILFASLFIGCRTVPIVPDNGSGAEQVRSDIAAIQDGQTGIAITGTNIENGGNQIASGLDNIEQSIISGTDADADFAEILRAVRKRPLE
jgi:hypothetical protein